VVSYSDFIIIPVSMCGFSLEVVLLSTRIPHTVLVTVELRYAKLITLLCVCACGKWDVGLRTGLGWLRIGIGGGRL
jgi:Na+/serine symporter